MKYLFVNPDWHNPSLHLTAKRWRALLSAELHRWVEYSIGYAIKKGEVITRSE